MPKKYSKEIEDKLDSALPDKKKKARKDKKEKKSATAKRSAKDKKKEKASAKSDEKRIVVKVDLPSPAVNGLLKAAKMSGGNLMSTMQAKIWVRE